MIIIKLMGGLGNQLFQYAFGKALALKHGVELKADITGIGERAGQTKRELEINHFDRTLSPASEKELEAYRKGKFSKALDLAVLFAGLGSERIYVREPHFHFSKLAMKAPADAYLDGYWQSERYFADVRKELIAALTNGVVLSEESSRLAGQMKEQNSVSIHVRRGDYVSVKQNQEIYSELPVSYYQKAIAKIAGMVKDPVFYVFSDEPGWFQENVKTDHKVIGISHNTGANSYQDLFLMSRCKHHIIANSSFSWWGAWLNEYVGKIVIAPAKWFRSDSKNTKDLIPRNWIKL